MRKWKVMFALLAAALVVPTGLGQTQDMQQRMHDLEKRLSAVEAENVTLKSQVADRDDEVLETQVNALLDRYAGTTVNSVANPITMTGELRFRTAWSLGDTPSLSSPSSPIGGGGPIFDEELDGSWTDALVRLGFMYEFTGDVTAFVELQSHYSFGDPTSGTFPGWSSPFSSPYGFFHGEVDTDLVLYQGWVEVRNVLNQPELSSRTGRQEIVLGNQFQFGNADWYSGWAIDGTVWTWEDESFRLIGIIARLSNLDRDLNQVPSYLSPHDDDELYSVYFTLKTIENHELDIYWVYINGHGLANSVSSLGHNAGGGGTGSNAYWHTIGGRIGGEFPDIVDGLDWNLEVAYQFGDANGTPITDVDGLAIEAEVGVVFDKSNMLRAFARFLWAEGGSGTDSGYIPLYPNRHSNTGFRARYGLFDLIPMTNVMTLQGGIHFNPDPSWTLGATVLWATTDEADTIIVTSDDDYGWEIDVWGEYRFTEQLTVGAGFAFLFPDDEGVALWFLDDDTHVLIYLQARLVF
jgi:hypothetical protein